MDILKRSVFVKSVKEFPFEGEVFQLEENDSLNTAFNALGKKGYLSAPIWSEKKQKYVGMFDMNNALMLFYTVDLLSSILPSDWIDENKALNLLTAKPKEEIKVADLLAHTEDDQNFSISMDLNSVGEDANMQAVLTLLSKDVKRVTVLSTKGGVEKVSKIITPSLITKLLDDTLKEVEREYGEEYLDELPSIFSQSPTLFLSGRKVITVKASASVRDAFLSILENKVSAVAVIDEDNKLLSSISNTDVRMFKSLETVAAERVLSERLHEQQQQQQQQEEEEEEEGEGSKDKDRSEGEEKSLMDYSCEDFVKLIREEFESKKITKVPYISVSDDFSLRRIISKLAFTRKHRVWVTDKNKHVVNVISVSDIARILLDALKE